MQSVRCSQSYNQSDTVSHTVSQIQSVRYCQSYSQSDTVSQTVSRADSAPAPRRMECNFMKPGEDIKLVDKGIKNKWRWSWIEEAGRDGKPFGSWSQKLRQPGACFCTLCARKILYGTSGKKCCHGTSSTLVIKQLYEQFNSHSRYPALNDRSRG